MNRNWVHNIDQFIASAQRNGVRMLMVGGGAVNFHGYQRHSADVDFWIETTTENFKRLIAVFQELGYEIDAFPQDVLEGNQNISVKFSPEDLDLELITRFSVNKSFDEAYESSELVVVNENEFLQWNVLSLDDLITSKLKAARPKDLLDVQQLRQINS
ncbi:nucleotidyltransferase [Flavobacterium sp. N1719]|uniref:nucleotidyltransferase n=1 Tax=Flavobacterium sp. N1719 TaxID=2885633 RepID=UPI00222147BE|nr:nucleotidyltransferase [Flavobacterium sp. N1719]